MAQEAPVHLVKLIVTNPANDEAAHIADVMPAKWRLAVSRLVAVDGIDHVHARRDNRVA